MASDHFESVIRDQIEKSSYISDLEYDAIVKTNGSAFKAIAVFSKTIRHDYVNSIFEEIIVSIAMTPLQRTDIVRMSQENLSITLIQKTPKGKFNKNETYMAIPIDTQDERIESNLSGIESAGTGNDTDIAIVTFQLIKRAAYNLRLWECGGIYNKCTALEVLKFILAHADLKDSMSTKDAVSQVIADESISAKKYTQIVIPDGTRFMGLIPFLQKEYGLSGQGIGCFLLDTRWYIHAPYNLLKTKLDINRLVIFNVATDKYAGITKNFQQDGRTTKIITTGESGSINLSNTDALNGGTGIVYGDINSLLPEALVDDPTTDPSRKTKDYLTSIRSSNHDSPLQNTVTAKNRFTHNALPMTSELAKRGGTYITVTWEGGIITPFIPGMPVIFWYNKFGKPHKLSGTLVSVEEHGSLLNNSLIEKRHQSSVKLTLFLKEY